MSNIIKFIKKQSHRDDIRTTYGRSHKHKCPLCKKPSLFKIIQRGHIFKKEVLECVICKRSFVYDKKGNTEEVYK